MNRLLTVVYVILWLLMVSWAAQAHGSTSMPRPNSLGVDQVYSNQNTYLFAVPIAGQLLEDGQYTNVRFQPYATMSLYDESVLFCGDVTGSFAGKSGPMVVTYHRVAHRMYRGIACHEIVSVFEVHDDQKVVKP